MNTILAASTFLALGTLGFWVLFGIAIIIMIIFFEVHETNYREDSGGGLWASVILLGAFAIYYFLGSKEDVTSLFSYVAENTATFIGFVIGYFAVGVVWSFFKWFFYLRRVRERLLERFTEIKEEDIPLAKKNVNRISTWISFWMLSALWTLLNDPVRNFSKYCVAIFGSWYDKMSQSAFEGVKVKKQA